MPIVGPNTRNESVTLDPNARRTGSKHLQMRGHASRDEARAREARAWRQTEATGSPRRNGGKRRRTKDRSRRAKRGWHRESDETRGTSEHTRCFEFRRSPYATRRPYAGDPTGLHVHSPRHPSCVSGRLRSSPPDAARACGSARFCRSAASRTFVLARTRAAPAQLCGRRKRVMSPPVSATRSSPPRGSRPGWCPGAPQGSKDEALIDLRVQALKRLVEISIFARIVSTRNA